MSSDQSSGDGGGCGAGVDQVLDVRLRAGGWRLSWRGRLGLDGAAYRRDWVGQHTDETGWGSILMCLRPLTRKRGGRVAAAAPDVVAEGRWTTRGSCTRSKILDRSAGAGEDGCCCCAGRRC